VESETFPQFAREIAQNANDLKLKAPTTKVFFKETMLTTGRNLRQHGEINTVTYRIHHSDYLTKPLENICMIVKLVNSYRYRSKL
jgi:hypothetical protein